MASKLDEQEAALYLSMMQLHEDLGQILDRKAHLQEKELIKQDPKCASGGCLGSKRDVEPSKWAQKGKPIEMLCSLCEMEAEHDYYDAEATEVDAYGMTASEHDSASRTAALDVMNGGNQ